MHIVEQNLTDCF